MRKERMGESNIKKSYGDRCMYVSVIVITHLH